MSEKHIDSEVLAILQGMSDLLPIKRMGELDEWASQIGIDSESRSKLISVLCSFFSKNNAIIDRAKKYAVDVAGIVALQKPISKEDRTEIGHVLRDFVEGFTDSEKARDYVISAVEIITDAFVMATSNGVAEVLIKQAAPAPAPAPLIRTSPDDTDDFSGSCKPLEIASIPTATAGEEPVSLHTPFRAIKTFPRSRSIFKGK